MTAEHPWLYTASMTSIPWWNDPVDTFSQPSISLPTTPGTRYTTFLQTGSLSGVLLPEFIPGHIISMAEKCNWLSALAETLVPLLYPGRLVLDIEAIIWLPESLHAFRQPEPARWRIGAGEPVSGRTELVIGTKNQRLGYIRLIIG